MPLERLGVELHLAGGKTFFLNFLFFSSPGGELAEVGEENEPLCRRVQLSCHLRHHHRLDVVHLESSSHFLSHSLTNLASQFNQLASIVGAGQGDGGDLIVLLTKPVVDVLVVG